jgi:hypothetical protein
VDERRRGEGVRVRKDGVQKERIALEHDDNWESPFRSTFRSATRYGR